MPGDNEARSCWSSGVHPWTPPFGPAFGSPVRARDATAFVAPVRRREDTLSVFATSPPHPGDFVAMLTPTYETKTFKGRIRRRYRLCTSSPRSGDSFVEVGVNDMNPNVGRNGTE